VKKFLPILLGVIFVTSIPAQSSEAAIKVGGSCSKVNAMQNYLGKQYICTRIGRSLKWKAVVSSTKTPISATKTTTPPKAEKVIWTNDGNGNWTSSGKAPSCASLQWALPIDSLAEVQNLLDPGQLRGGRYKAHGGLQMARSATIVRSPIDGYIVSAAAYRETVTGQPGPGGEVQYLIDIQNPCGVAVRFDHLKVLDPVLTRALGAISVRDDSRTTQITPPLQLSRGDVLATVVGHTETGLNPSFDFGAYDYRTTQYNRRSVAELRAFGPDGQLGLYALCWLDLFGSTNSASLRSIPRTNIEAAQGSDICR